MTGKSRETVEKEKEKALRAKAKLEEEKRAKEEAALLNPFRRRKYPLEWIQRRCCVPSTRRAIVRKEQNANSVMILMWDARWRRRIYMRIVERKNYKVVLLFFFNLVSKFTIIQS